MIPTSFAHFGAIEKHWKSFAAGRIRKAGRAGKKPKTRQFEFYNKYGMYRNSRKR
jgi:hypothetical protein